MEVPWVAEKTRNSHEAPPGHFQLWGEVFWEGGLTLAGVRVVQVTGWRGIGKFWM